MRTKGLRAWGRERSSAIQAAIALRLSLPICSKALRASMLALLACHDRPLAKKADEADNDTGSGSHGLNPRGLDCLASRLRGWLGFSISLGAHHGPPPSPS